MYTAVVTTGIYCRTGCPAQPLQRNTRGYEFAAAAESNGFRPCRRCRPDASPGPGTWVSPSELVCRALRLISDGALDTAGEDELGARLGVTARHLRRLFAEHVGANPDAVARSRRAHFARALLDDTELGVATVGFAAGFNSVRQMNRAMLQTFRASPRELRARRRRPERLVADGGLEVQLPYKPPIAWDDILAYLAPRATPGVEAVDGGTWRRVVRHEGHPALIEATAHGEHVRVRLHLPSFAGLIHLAAGVRSTFGLDDDVREANAVLRRDPLLRTSMRRRPGLRVPGAWDPFELGVRAIVGQQVSVKSATTIIGRIAERHGEPVDGLGPLGLHRLFPEAEKLAEAGLGGAGLTRTRADAVRAFARACAEGDVALDGSWSLGEVVEALEALPGIGGWTAHYIAMRGARERDAFPSGDLGLRRASGLTPAQLERRAEAWRPWRSTAAMHLWLGAAD